jgi:hypothetical protein
MLVALLLPRSPCGQILCGESFQENVVNLSNGKKK